MGPGAAVAMGGRVQGIAPYRIHCTILEHV